MRTRSGYREQSGMQIWSTTVTVVDQEQFDQGPFRFGQSYHDGVNRRRAMANEAEKCAKTFEEAAEDERRGVKISLELATEITGLVERNGLWIAEAIRVSRYYR